MNKQIPMWNLTQIIKPVIACIYAFNDEKNIENTIEVSRQLVDDLIVCDDGSTDNTNTLAKNMGVKVIHHETYLGYGVSLKDLFTASMESNPDYIVTYDSNDPNIRNTPKLLERLNKNDADIVVLSTATTIPAPGITEPSSPTTASSFRAYNLRAVTALNKIFANTLTKENLSQTSQLIGLKVIYIPLESPPAKTTNIHPEKDEQTPNLILTLMNNSMLVFGLPGVVALLAALGFGLWAIRAFQVSGIFSTNLLLIATSSAEIGLILVATSLLLYEKAHRKQK
jgi:hypothetical protein